MKLTDAYRASGDRRITRKCWGHRFISYSCQEKEWQDEEGNVYSFDYLTLLGNDDWSPYVAPPPPPLSAEQALALLFSGTPITTSTDTQAELAFLFSPASGLQACVIKYGYWIPDVATDLLEALRDTSASWRELTKEELKQNPSLSER